MSFTRAAGRRRIATSVLAVGIVAAVLALPGSGSAAPGQESGTTLREEYDEIIGREADLIAAVEGARVRQVELTAELERLQGELSDTRVRLVEAQVELVEAEEASARQALLLDAAARRVDRAEEQLRRQIVASYVTGGADGGQLEAILKATDGEQAGRAIAYSKAIVGDSEAAVRALEDARAGQAEARRAARRGEEAAQERRDDIEAAARFVEGAVVRQQEIVTEVNAEVVAEAVALQEIQGRKALVEGRINAMNRTSDGVSMVLAAAQAGQPDWTPSAFEVTTPIPGYRIGSRFGPRQHPILNITRLHAGGDIGAPSGTPIHAVADGYVLLAGDRGGYGNTVVIDHGHSLGTLSAHMSTLAVQPGDPVERGDVIGTVGSTGLSTGPHLHLETRIKGMPIDPEGVIDFVSPVDYGR